MREGRVDGGDEVRLMPGGDVYVVMKWTRRVSTVCRCDWCSERGNRWLAVLSVVCARASSATMEGIERLAHAGDGNSFVSSLVGQSMTSPSSNRLDVGSCCWNSYSD